MEIRARGIEVQASNSEFRADIVKVGGRSLPACVTNEQMDLRTATDLSSGEQTPHEIAVAENGNTLSRQRKINTKAITYMFRYGNLVRGRLASRKKIGEDRSANPFDCMQRTWRGASAARAS